MRGMALVVPLLLVGRLFLYPVAVADPGEVTATVAGFVAPGSPSTTAPVSTRAPVADRSEAPVVSRQAVKVRKHSPRAETAELPLAAAVPGSRTVSPDGAWSWFADPRAVRFRDARDRTYLGWITRLGDVQVAQYDHDSRLLTTATLATRFAVDDHNNPVVVVRPDGRLMAFWSGHVGSRMYFRVTTQPADVSAWGPTRTLPVQAPGLAGYTYPNPLFSAAESNRLYLFWRAGSQPAYSWSDDFGGTWAERGRSSATLASAPMSR